MQNITFSHRANSASFVRCNIAKTYSNAVLGRKALFDAIQIIVPTGEITDNNIKITMFDISDINFAVAGFYHFSITCQVNGNDVVMHYALQII